VESGLHGVRDVDHRRDGPVDRIIGRDADDAEQSIVQTDGTSDDAGIPCEMQVPCAFGQHDDGFTPTRGSIRFHESSSDLQWPDVGR
jgi:hypothetical protein